MKPMFYCSLNLVYVVSVNMCLIYLCLSSTSAVICSCPQQSAFSRNSFYTFYSRNPTCEIRPCLRISNSKYPPCPQNSIILKPPSPLEILKAIRGIGMDIFWNRPINAICIWAQLLKGWIKPSTKKIALQWILRVDKTNYSMLSIG